MPSCCATFFAVRYISPTSTSRLGSRSLMLAMCFFGITSTCTGACGWMSRKASTASFSNTVSGLIWPLTILQKRQSLLMHPSSFAHVSAQYEPLTARKKPVGPVARREALVVCCCVFALFLFFCVCFWFCCSCCVCCV